MEDIGTLGTVGAGCFGLVIGWVTYRTVRRSTDKVQLSDIATVLGAVGGAAVTKTFDSGDAFGAYCVGLAVGFFLYLLVALKLDGKEGVSPFMDAKQQFMDSQGGR